MVSGRMTSSNAFLPRGDRHPPPEVAEVVEEYAQALGLQAGFDDPPKGWRPPPRDGRLWCINDSAPIPPKLFGRLPILPRVERGAIFGHSLPKDAWTALGETRRPGRGTFIRDDDRLVVAEVKRTACYLSFDLLSWPGPTAAVVLRKVLDAALITCGEVLAIGSTLSSDARQLAIKTLAQGTMEADAELARQRDREARETLIEAGKSHASSRREYLEAEIASLERNLAEFSRRITTDSRRLFMYQRELASLEGDDGEEPVDFAAEYDQIRAHQLVHELTASDDRFIVTTLPLTAIFEEEPIDLGRFEIKVSFDGDVRITNLTRRFWFYDHPHIREGVPCLGNIQEGVAKLIGTYQFAAVSQVLIDFLQLVNPKEWVVSAHYWRDHGGSVSHD